MHRAQGVADQDNVADMPAAGLEERKLPPDRFIGHERVSAKIGGKHALAVAAAFPVGHPIETGVPPCNLVTFNHERAHSRTMAIMMRDEMAVLVLAKS